jgi:hypothetical protein
MKTAYNPWSPISDVSASVSDDRIEAAGTAGV